MGRINGNGSGERVTGLGMGAIDLHLFDPRFHRWQTILEVARRMQRQGSVEIEGIRGGRGGQGGSGTNPLLLPATRIGRDDDLTARLGNGKRLRFLSRSILSRHDWEDWN
jgi:hypothetical protein